MKILSLATVTWLGLSGAVADAQLARVQYLPNPGTEPSFADFLAADQDVLVASARRSDTVHVFVADAGRWTVVQELVSPWSPSGVSFGAAIDVSQDLIAVGAPGEPNGGAVHLYRRQAGGNQFVLEANLTADDTSPGDAFGSAVALDGSTLAVGSRNHSHPETATGSVHLFNQTAGRAGGWSQTSELFSATREPYAGWGFGTPLDLNGTTLLVGTTGGQAQAFQPLLGTWTWSQTLQPPDRGYSFGQSLALSSSAAIVGEPSYSPARGTSAKGRAHLYTRPSPRAPWRVAQRLAPQRVGEQFARDIAAAGNLIAVTDTGAPEIGTELQVHRLSPSGQWNLIGSTSHGSEFGAVAITGRDIIVRDRELWSGASYLVVYRVRD